MDVDTASAAPPAEDTAAMLAPQADAGAAAGEQQQSGALVACRQRARGAREGDGGGEAWAGPSALALFLCPDASSCARLAASIACALRCECYAGAVRARAHR